MVGKSRAKDRRPYSLTRPLTHRPAYSRIIKRRIRKLPINEIIAEVWRGETLPVAGGEEFASGAFSTLLVPVVGLRGTLPDCFVIFPGDPTIQS